MIIHADNLWAAYRVTPVLRDLCWQWRAGEQWAIIGDNGAGKTAVARLITDQLRPQRGRIACAFKEREIIHLSFELQRQLIEQDLRFDDSEHRADAADIGTTVQQVVLRGQPADERFLTLARQCRIDHILDRGIRFVSTGESRKTLLARALYHHPKLLILDNPFEGLDGESQQQLKALINQLLLTDLAVLLLIKQADEVPDNISHLLWLEQGLVKGSGQRDDVLRQFGAGHQQITLAKLPAGKKRDYRVDQAQPLIDLSGVNLSYNDQAILTDIHWRFEWGQHCCIAGPNGAGKSSLLSLLCGDNHKAYGQSITLFGQRRGSGESIWQLKEKFGMVSTPLQLNHGGRIRVAEVIASGLYDSIGLHKTCSGQDRKLALDWLQLMGLEHIATTMYNQISFGQQRLVMLARAMVKSPLVLILDEPCIGLDLPHRQLILALIDKIAERGDCHILYVSHSANEMPACINQLLRLVPHQEGGYTAKLKTDF